MSCGVCIKPISQNDRYDCPGAANLYPGAGHPPYHRWCITQVAEGTRNWGFPPQCPHEGCSTSIESLLPPISLFQKLNIRASSLFQKLDISTRNLGPLSLSATILSGLAALGIFAPMLSIASRITGVNPVESAFLMSIMTLGLIEKAKKLERFQVNLRDPMLISILRIAIIAPPIVLGIIYKIADADYRSGIVLGMIGPFAALLILGRISSTGHPLDISWNEMVRQAPRR